MRLRADFSVFEALGPDEPAFIASPMPGVMRRMLDRVGDEKARATSVVRYAPGSRFSPHSHDLGEEYLVLRGVFSDQSGDGPTGFYVRNPPGSAHAPWSHEGCDIFVKLRQFAPDDQKPVRLDTRDRALFRTQAPGLSRAELHRFGAESVGMEHWAAGLRREFAGEGGVEILVVAGALVHAGREWPARSWLRSPHGRPLVPSAGPDGAEIFVKTGHLPAQAA